MSLPCGGVINAEKLSISVEKLCVVVFYQYLQRHIDSSFFAVIGRKVVQAVPMKAAQEINWASNSPQVEDALPRLFILMSEEDKLNRHFRIVKMIILFSELYLMGPT